MKTIPLTKGQVALVDDADYKWLNQWKWHTEQIGHTFYATHEVYIAKDNRRNERMHRLILDLQPSDKRQCDHVDRNGLNNQRSNLRICTATQNQQNQRKRANCTSKYKGVYWHRNNHKWRPRIRINGKYISLRYFNLETDAAQTYDKAALKHFGKFALTNKMLGLL